MAETKNLWNFLPCWSIHFFFQCMLFFYITFPVLPSFAFTLKCVQQAYVSYLICFLNQHLPVVNMVHFKVLWWLFWMDCPALVLHRALNLTVLVEPDIRLMSKTFIQTSSFQKPLLPRTQEDNGVSDFNCIVIKQFELMENMSKNLQHPLLKEFYLSFSWLPLFFMNDGHHS